MWLGRLLSPRTRITRIMRTRITTLPGDGIGPEVTAEAVRVLQATAAIHGYRFEFEEHAIGGVAIRQFGSPLPRNTLDACLASDAVLLGAVGAPEYDRLPPNQRPEAGLLLLRSALGGYANRARRSPIRRLRRARRCALRSLTALTFSSYASCSGGSISVNREVSTRQTGLQSRTTRCGIQSRRSSASRASHSKPP